MTDASARRTKLGAATTFVAALFLFLAALVYLTSWLRVRSIDASFDRRSAQHLASDVDRIRRDVAGLETSLDAAAARIAAAAAGKETDRAALFRILGAEIKGSDRGARIVDQSDTAVAWWGEDYRAPAERTYQFDVTNL
jgi:hypothetical protein